MNGFGDRRAYVEHCVRRAEQYPQHKAAWTKEAERVAGDIRFFATAMKKDGVPHPSWAPDYRP